MAPPLPPQAPALVSFDFVDIANGTGVETYFLIQSEDNSGVDYHLTPNTDFSSKAFIDSMPADVDFDLSPFIIPRTVNGVATFSLTVFNNAGGNIATTVELYRVRGGVETQIGSTISQTRNITNNVMLYLRMPIVNELFAVGDNLRLRVTMTASGGTTRLGTDPANRTDADLTITTTSKINISYKLDN